MVENTEKEFYKELDILEKHYTLFDSPRANVFISLFEDSTSRNIMIEQYSKIAEQNGQHVYLIHDTNSLEQYINHVEKDAISQGEYPKFEKTTFLFDTYSNNGGNELLLLAILNHFYDLHKHSQAKMHFLTQAYQLQTIISQTDVWQFRDKVFHYPEGFVNSLFLKNKMIEELSESQNTTRKMKV